MARKSSFDNFGNRSKFVLKIVLVFKIEVQQKFGGFLKCFVFIFGKLEMRGVVSLISNKQNNNFCVSEKRQFFIFEIYWENHCLRLTLWTTEHKNSVEKMNFCFLFFQTHTQQKLGSIVRC